MGTNLTNVYDDVQATIKKQSNIYTEPMTELVNTANKSLSGSIGFKPSTTGTEVIDKINAQTAAIKNETDSLRQLEMSGNVNNRKTEYQMEMTQSLRTFNTYLLYFYYFLFLLIHVLLAEQYFRGIKRNELIDTIWFTGFFLYPVVIYYIESYLYFAFSYILAFIYGKSYVYNFNSLLVNTNFYQDPVDANVPTFAVNT
jgi:hypothetical protein